MPAASLLAALPIALVAIGTALLALALPAAHRLYRHTPKHELGWKTLLGLIVFFILGYLTFGYFLLHSPGAFIELVVALVFLGGAGFVLIVMQMSFNTLMHMQQSAERERHRALHDELTALPNRTLLYERIVYTIAMAKREGTSFAVMLMDLDRFKDVNDTLGHLCGDALLTEVAARLTKVVRASDTVARLGGDEFAVLLPGAGMAQAVVVAEKIATVMEGTFAVQGHNLSVGISIGICVYPTHAREADALLARADIAMYNAKRKDYGDVAYAVYDTDQDRHTLESLTLMAELREAVRAGELTLVYQPKVAVADGHVCGVEALARWPHPLRGMIPPAKFIPLAEQTGLINALTRWVLEAAIKQCAAWRSAGLRVPVSVNVSLKDLRDLQFPSHVDQLLRQWELPAGDLTLEVTESSMMADVERSCEVIRRLQRLGVRIAIDDFGTGYSSLAHLRRLRTAEIKIDRSFVIDMTRDDNDAVIVRSTVELAHNMGLTVTAEGVETQEILDLLGTLGCDVAQGYHLARPLPADELATWLRARTVPPRTG